MRHPKDMEGKAKVDQALISIKQQWPTYGVSIVSDGWAKTPRKSHLSSNGCFRR
jgi:hypothetical protein